MEILISDGVKITKQEKILPPRGLHDTHGRGAAPLNFSWVKFSTLFFGSMTSNVDKSEKFARIFGKGSNDMDSKLLGKEGQVGHAYFHLLSQEKRGVYQKEFFWR